jgi:hypothetical protein
MLPPAAREDQYLWANHARGAYFSRWGLFNTLAFAVPLLVQHNGRPNLLSLLNAFNALVAALFVAGLLVACRHTGDRKGNTVAFVLAWALASYIAYYMRAQSAEIIQCTLAAWALAAFCTVNARLDARVPALGPVIGLNVLFAALVLSKLQFLAWWLIALACTFAGRPLREARVLRPAVVSVCILAAAIALQLWSNIYKFGGPFEAGMLGYPFPHDTRGFELSIRAYSETLPQFTWGRNRSLPLHAPLIIFAVIGALAHARRQPREAVFVWGAFLTGILTAALIPYHPEMGMEWAFGPRQVVQSIVPLVLVGATAWNAATAAGVFLPIRAFVRIAFVVVTLYGVSVEILVGAYNPFAAQQVLGRFRSEPLPPEGEAYLDRVSQLQLLVDLRNLCERGAGPLALLSKDQARLIGRERADRLLDHIAPYCLANLALMQQR